MTETKLRSFFKAISWRFIATLITFSAAAIEDKELIKEKLREMGYLE